MQPNVLMCVCVLSQIRHRIDLLARFRCAGSVGHSAYEELVFTKGVPSCVEVSEATVDGANRSPFCPVEGMPLPMHAPYKGSHCLKNVGVILVLGAALARCQKPEETRQKKFQRAIFEWGGDKVPNVFHGFPFTRHAELRGFEDVSTLGMGFLEGFPMLLEIDLTPLRNVTMIGANFMRGNTLLQKICLSPFSNVTSIGDGFMRECKSVLRLDLSPLTKVTFVGSHFLSETGGVLGRSFAQMVSLNSVGPFLFDHSPSLTAIDLTPIVKKPTITATIPSNLLSHCGRLQAVKLTPLSNITAIEDYFLAYTGLTTIDLSPLVCIQVIGNHFLEGCGGLSSIDLAPLGRVSNIGQYFMALCGGLETVDLTPLEAVNTIHPFLFGKCHNLKFVKGSIPNNMPFLHGLPKAPAPTPAAPEKEVRRHKPVSKHVKKESKVESKKQKSKYNRYEE